MTYPTHWQSTQNFQLVPRCRSNPSMGGVDPLNAPTSLPVDDTLHIQSDLSPHNMSQHCCVMGLAHNPPLSLPLDANLPFTSEKSPTLGTTCPPICPNHAHVSWEYGTYSFPPVSKQLSELCFARAETRTLGVAHKLRTSPSGGERLTVRSKHGRVGVFFFAGARQLIDHPPCRRTDSHEK